jgi:multiple sugar transport system permease protein
MSDEYRANPVWTWRKVTSFILLCLVAVIFVSPLVFMVGTSLKIPAEVFAKPPTLVGSEIRWQNYIEAFNYAPFGRYMLNSIVVGLTGTAINLVVCTLAGYAFSRLKWRFSGVVFSVFLATMMIPQEVLIIPMFVMMQQLKWQDSFPGLIVPWAFGALGAFMLRQFFMTVPQELDDAARVDGCGVVRTFLTIMVPLARPTLSVLAVFSFIGYWNAFLWPLIIVNRVNDMGTVTLGLQTFFGQQGSQWHLIMAASVMSMAPMIILLLIFQKNLIKGIVTSGLGGR